MHGFFGNSAQSSGYACLAIKLVNDWRAIWSKNSVSRLASGSFILCGLCFLWWLTVALALVE
jgi:hypothetical protein